MAGEQKSFINIVDDFNIAAQTVFDKEYAEYEPELKDFAYQFNSGAVPSTKFLINLLFGSIKDFKGTIEYRRVDEVIQQLVTNKEFYVEGIEIPNRDFKRAMKANDITGLDMFIKSIGNLVRIARDGPFEKMLELLEAGAGTTLGTCFDNDPLFSTSYAFDKTAGNQSNLITGSGTDPAQISTDIKEAMNRLSGFFYLMDQDSSADEKKRKLNRGQARKLVVLCDPSIEKQVDDVRVLRNLSISGGSTQDNTLRNSFSIVTRFFADSNDYYIIDISEPTIKPFLISKEDDGRLLSPQDNPEALSNLQVHRYSYNELSFGNAYGAWWKILKVNN